MTGNRLILVAFLAVVAVYAATAGRALLTDWPQ